MVAKSCGLWCSAACSLARSHGKSSGPPAEPSLAGAEPFVLHFNSAAGKDHLYRVAAHVLGDAGAALAESAQWEGGSWQNYLLHPARLLYTVALPWRARAAINAAEVTDAVAIAIAAGLALAAAAAGIRAGLCARCSAGAHAGWCWARGRVLQGARA